jgi:hypothetical protein
VPESALKRIPAPGVFVATLLTLASTRIKSVYVDGIELNVIVPALLRVVVAIGV